MTEKRELSLNSAESDPWFFKYPESESSANKSSVRNL